MNKIDTNMRFSLTVFYLGFVIFPLSDPGDICKQCLPLSIVEYHIEEMRGIPGKDPRHPGTEGQDPTKTGNPRMEGTTVLDGQESFHQLLTPIHMAVQCTCSCTPIRSRREAEVTQMTHRGSHMSMTHRVSHVLVRKYFKFIFSI